MTMLITLKVKPLLNQQKDELIEDIINQVSDLKDMSIEVLFAEEIDSLREEPPEVISPNTLKNANKK